MSKQPLECTLSTGGTVPSRNGSSRVSPQLPGRMPLNLQTVSMVTPAGCAKSVCGTGLRPFQSHLRFSAISMKSCHR